MLWIEIFYLELGGSNGLKTCKKNYLTCYLKDYYVMRKGLEKWIIIFKHVEKSEEIFGWFELKFSIWN